MERSPTAERPIYAGEPRRIYRVVRKFDGLRTTAEMVESLMRAHS